MLSTYVLDSLLCRGPLRLEPILTLPCNQYEFPSQPAAHAGSENTTGRAWIQLQDPIIYPGIYSASGIDVMGILVRKHISHISYNTAALQQCQVLGLFSNWLTISCELWLDPILALISALSTALCRSHYAISAYQIHPSSMPLPASMN